MRVRNSSTAGRLAFVGVSLSAGVLGIAGCGGDDGTADTTLVPILTTTTTVAPATTPAPESTAPAGTTTVAPSTSTTVGASTTTSTTIPAAAALTLRADGLGDALFGADPVEVVTYLTSILGEPTADSGWGSATGSFGVCPGTEVRGVTWGDLVVLFTDTSPLAANHRHFFTYYYGPPPSESTILPEGMVTEKGIGVDSTVGDLTTAYPEARIYPEDVFGPYFVIEDGLIGFLSGTTESDTVLSFIGGPGCGE